MFCSTSTQMCQPFFPEPTCPSQYKQSVENMGGIYSLFWDDAPVETENTGSADVVRYMMEEQEREQKASNFLKACEHVLEDKSAQFYRARMTIWTWTIFAEKNHKGLFVQHSIPNMEQYFIELGIDRDMRDGKIFYPHLRCMRDKSANQPTDKVFEVYMNQSLMHNFATAYHHKLKHYDPFKRNCQAFVWYILYSHDVDPSLLHGICEFGDGLPPVDIRNLANTNRAEYRRTKPQGLTV